MAELTVTVLPRGGAVGLDAMTCSEPGGECHANANWLQPPSRVALLKSPQAKPPWVHLMEIMGHLIGLEMLFPITHTLRRLQWCMLSPSPTQAEVAWSGPHPGGPTFQVFLCASDMAAVCPPQGWTPCPPDSHMSLTLVASSGKHAFPAHPV